MLIWLGKALGLDLQLDTVLEVGWILSTSPLPQGHFEWPLQHPESILCNPGVHTNNFDLALLYFRYYFEFKTYTVFPPSPTVRLNLILILSLADMKWKQYLPLLPLPASK